MHSSCFKQIRDEAHRFAITYHKKLRDKKTYYSELDAIEGIGEKEDASSILIFGSVQK